MKNVMITPTTLSGSIKAIPSKSLCHRAIIAAGLSSSTCKITNVTMSKDITATCRVMKNFGVDILEEPGLLKIKGPEKITIHNKIMDCFESGSTLRFLIPMALLSGEEATFIGRGRLVERPLDPYFEIFKTQDIEYHSEGSVLPLAVKGRLKPGKFSLRGDISSQFITGLMFILPLLESDSEIIISSPLESKGYVDLTMDVLKRFSVDIVNNSYTSFNIKGRQEYRASDLRVEGDYSQAAFWIAAGLLGGDVRVSDVDINSLQGDKVILDICKAMNGRLSLSDNKVTASLSNLEGTEIDASQCPDLVPILSVLGALSTGTTRIFNAKRLRIKESDRLAAVCKELSKLGADIHEDEDSLTIKGKPMLNGGIVESWGDHRIAMSMAIASIKCKEPVIIKDSHVVDKSYPSFFEDFILLGGRFNEWSMGQ